MLYETQALAPNLKYRNIKVLPLWIKDHTLQINVADIWLFFLSLYYYINQNLCSVLLDVE